MMELLGPFALNKGHGFPAVALTIIFFRFIFGWPAK
jgi:hypothetical protein